MAMLKGGGEPYRGDLSHTDSVKINWDPGYLMEKAMAPHSSTLAWKIPWMEEPGRLKSMGSLGVAHD